MICLYTESYFLEERIKRRNRWIKLGLIGLALLFFVLWRVYLHLYETKEIDFYFSHYGVIDILQVKNKNYFVLARWFKRFFIFSLIVILFVFLTLRVKTFEAQGYSFLVSFNIIKKNVYVDYVKKGSAWLLPLVYRPIAIKLDDGTNCYVVKTITFFTSFYVSFSSDELPISK